MQKIYISGKISGLPIEQAELNFRRIEQYLSDEYEVVNPMTLTEHAAIIACKDLSDIEKWRLHMKADIKAMMECDGVFLMENYTDSNGAIIEAELAIKLGMFCLYQNKSTRHLTT